MIIWKRKIKYSWFWSADVHVSNASATIPGLILINAEWASNIVLNQDNSMDIEKMEDFTWFSGDMHGSPAFFFILLDVVAELRIHQRLFAAHAALLTVFYPEKLFVYAVLLSVMSKSSGHERLISAAFFKTLATVFLDTPQLCAMFLSLNPKLFKRRISRYLVIIYDLLYLYSHQRCVFTV